MPKSALAEQRSFFVTALRQRDPQTVFALDRRPSTLDPPLDPRPSILDTRGLGILASAAPALLSAFLMCLLFPNRIAFAAAVVGLGRVC